MKQIADYNLYYKQIYPKLKEIGFKHSSSVILKDYLESSSVFVYEKYNNFFFGDYLRINLIIKPFLNKYEVHFFRGDILIEGNLDKMDLFNIKNVLDKNTNK